MVLGFGCGVLVVVWFGKSASIPLDDLMSTTRDSDRHVLLRRQGPAGNGSRILTSDGNVCRTTEMNAYENVQMRLESVRSVPWSLTSGFK